MPSTKSSQTMKTGGVEQFAEGPTAATIESMMGRLSTRLSAGEAAGSAATASSSSGALLRGEPISSRRKIDTPPAALGGAADDALDGFVAAGLVPPLPHSVSTSGEGNERAGYMSQHLPTTPLRNEGTRPEVVSRYTISSPADEANNPWLRSHHPTDEEGAEKAAAASAAPPAVVMPDATAMAAATAEAFLPLLAELKHELKKDIKREVQEAQCAIMEQNFKLHAALRRDLDELRAEVQQLRGELRVL
eukprot:TRINITY_DN31775_c0_g1_i1.p1 TRINITY_DN31775_c0_g1~~TRINITY_DN31775_c0_g1_i1.p1  ORF type:complete len:248 (-),score=70.39 TRINITY_DN31775_c0_g1_i1:147-890(-)